MAEQLRIVKPKMVLCLGHAVRRFMVECAAGSLDAWKGEPTIKELDEDGRAVQPKVAFPSHLVDAVVLLTHPCRPGGHKRRWRGEAGLAAEEAMVRYACRLAGLSEIIRPQDELSRAD